MWMLVRALWKKMRWPSWTSKTLDLQLRGQLTVKECWGNPTPPGWIRSRFWLRGFTSGGTPEAQRSPTQSNTQVDSQQKLLRSGWQEGRTDAADQANWRCCKSYWHWPLLKQNLSKQPGLTDGLQMFTTLYWLFDPNNPFLSPATADFRHERACGVPSNWGRAICQFHWNEQSHHRIAVIAMKLCLTLGILLPCSILFARCASRSLSRWTSWWQCGDIFRIFRTFGRKAVLNSKPLDLDDSA